MCAAVYYLLNAEPLVYLIKMIIRACVLLCTLCQEHSPGVSDQDYPSVCAAVYRVLEAEPWVYLIKIIQVCVLLCTMCWRQRTCCI